jgi:hypothetical protein
MSQLLGLPNFLRPLGSVGPCTWLQDGRLKRYITVTNKVQVDDDDIHCDAIKNAKLRGLIVGENGEFTLEIEGRNVTFKEIDNDNEEYPIRYFNPYLDPPSQQAFKKSRSKKSKGVKKSKGSKKSKGKKKSKGSKKSN